jgi:hypothetical protein
MLRKVNLPPPPEPPKPEDIARIPITNTGDTFIIDKEDAERVLSLGNWKYIGRDKQLAINIISKRQIAALQEDPVFEADRTFIAIHRWIARITDTRLIIQFLNGDPRDCRKANLYVTTRRAESLVAELRDVLEVVQQAESLGGIRDRGITTICDQIYKVDPRRGSNG